MDTKPIYVPDDGTTSLMMERERELEEEIQLRAEWEKIHIRVALLPVNGEWREVPFGQLVATDREDLRTRIVWRKRRPEEMS